MDARMEALEHALRGLIGVEPGPATWTAMEVASVAIRLGQELPGRPPVLINELAADGQVLMIGPGAYEAFASEPPPVVEIARNSRLVIEEGLADLAERWSAIGRRPPTTAELTARLLGLVPGPYAYLGRDHVEADRAVVGALDLWHREGFEDGDLADVEILPDLWIRIASEDVEAYSRVLAVLADHGYQRGRFDPAVVFPSLKVLQAELGEKGPLAGLVDRFVHAVIEAHGHDWR